MEKFVRTKTYASGDLTPEEREKMSKHCDLWIKRAFRTEPIEPDKIIPAIEGIYAAAKLKKPRVVIVPSPLVMAFAYGASAAILYQRKNGKEAATGDATRDATGAATRDATWAATWAATGAATGDATGAATRDATWAATGAATGAATEAATGDATRDATRAATEAATGDATRDATRAATWAATEAATRDATRDATWAATEAATGAAEFGASQVCLEMAGKLGLECAKRWSNSYQGGNMWAGYDSYLTACRDILGLELREHAAYTAWEQAAIHGGFRVMHEDFCMVSDFPEFIKRDEQNRPHCEDGPSHRWRDGWELYFWHGVRLPAEWVINRKTIDPSEIVKAKNTEQRAAGLAMIGWGRALPALKCKVIDDSGSDDIGQLIELTMPGLREPGLFLKAKCPRNGLICEGVPRVSDIDGLPIDTALAAQAWRIGDPQSEYTHPEIRS